MDKAESMLHEACLSDYLWEFSVQHAVHLYNCTSMAQLSNHMPFSMMHKGTVPDLSHLKIFGCAAYMFLPVDIRKDKLAPKSEVMTYLGIAEGLKAHTFLCSSNKLFFGTKALFDEEWFLHCKNNQGLTCLNRPLSEQPSRLTSQADSQSPANPPTIPSDYLEPTNYPRVVPTTTPHALRTSGPAPIRTPRLQRQRGLPTPPLQCAVPVQSLDSPP